MAGLARQWRAALHRVDDAIGEALLRVVEPAAINAAVEAEAQAASPRDQVRDAPVRDLEAARYSANRAFRQYDAIYPQNWLVAAELELRWNRALTRVGEIESRIAAHDGSNWNHHFCRQYTSLRSPPISRLSGRRRRPTRGSRSASYAPSSTRWSPISMKKRQRSFS
ncbi:hypothetical protein MPL3356_10004 [Mesorhizobium plurifarium]|uniref:Uncharacterized protein n=1 Tax=Mesorhizobium plurifarium TaxID=69974 RepID=A0A090EW82_MESPL|nr:hypothetical protein MPL3356_10004 [Mesorhizobium plurifarium]